MNNFKEKLNNLLFNNGFLKLVSLFLAFVAYVVVAMYINPTKDWTVTDIPINIDVHNASIEKQGLNLLSSNIAAANVKVSGKNYIVTNLSEKDIAINASLSTVSGAGAYDLKLEAVNKSGKDFVITGVTPGVVKVKFDKLLSRKFPVTAQIENFTMPEGYMSPDEKPLVTPGEITITGPEVELDKIAKCVVKKDLENSPLNKTTVLKLPIELQDKNGNPVQSDELKLEYDIADVKLTIFKNKQIPLSIGFTNVPANFPIEELEYTISNEKIWVAGPTDQIDNLTGVNVGYVDLKTLTPDNNVYNFDVVLPADFSNVQHIESVTVEFDTTGMSEKKFYVSNLRVINAPVGYNVTLLTKQLSNVTVVGPKKIVDKLTAKDIVGEIDLSDRKITSGQIEMPISMIVPGKGLVWSTGTYTAVVNIREK
ncbi:CdaR family protein [Hydrogenoanaerobacterium sp.]|uniref:CdaR family protein n=1 Tax=Hydrogenoanaerobacterium sp. TaxID=2953763 RepID=UPI00289D1062|nr:CdaR family protein [Hydrogenoanaerobacterium sp.]